MRTLRSGKAKLAPFRWLDDYAGARLIELSLTSMAGLARIARLIDR